MTTEHTMFLTTKQVVGDDAVQQLVRQLRKLALMDPADLLDRLSKGQPTPLNEMALETNTAPQQRSWESVERASPKALTEGQYQAFLRGESPTAELGKADAELERYVSYQAVLSFLRTSRREWIAFASVTLGIAALSAIASWGLFPFERIQDLSPWGFGILGGFAGFLAVKKSTSLSDHQHEALRRSPPDKIDTHE